MDEMEHFNNVLNFGQSFYQSCDLDICILSKFYQFVVVKFMNYSLLHPISENAHFLCVKFLKIKFIQQK